jgi:DNA repair protein RecN (Recombination protein N)
VELLRSTASRLINFYGQHEQRRLMIEKAQAQLLDSSADGKGEQLHAVFVQARAQAAAAARAVQVLRAQETAGERELDLARFELSELEDIDPQPGEEAQLMEELRRLEGADIGRSACTLGHTALAGDEHAPGAVSLVSSAAVALEGLDTGATSELAERLNSARLELDDIAEELGRLGSDWEADPIRQAAVQSRLEAFHRMERKHRCDFDGLAGIMESLRASVHAADDRPQLIEAAEAKAVETLALAEQAAAKLTAWRTKRAPQLSKSVGAVLGELAMADARFDVRLLAFEGEGLARLRDGGAERVVFYLQANPGLPEEELASVASGGEASRLMLALISQSSSRGGGLLVLDEPDAGLGGQTAHGVAARLLALAEHQQVLVISHLPQIAARAHCHFRLYKQVNGGATATAIEPLGSEQERLDELCRLAGHSPDDKAARKAIAALRR